MAHQHPCFFLDANCINARQKIDALNELEILRNQGRITLVLSESAHREASFGNILRESKASDFSYTLSRKIENSHTWQAIENILFPNGAKTQNQQNDIMAVYHAERIGWPLITMDGDSRTQPGGILGNAENLSKIGITVIRPEAALVMANQMLNSKSNQEA